MLLCLITPQATNFSPLTHHADNLEPVHVVENPFATLVNGIKSIYQVGIVLTKLIIFQRTDESYIILE